MVESTESISLSSSRHEVGPHWANVPSVLARPQLDRRGNGIYVSGHFMSWDGTWWELASELLV